PGPRPGAGAHAASPKGSPSSASGLPRAAPRGSSGRALAGAVRIGNTVSAAITNRRVLEPVEAHIALISGGLLLALAALAVKFPRGLAYPLALVVAWIGGTLLYRGIRLHTKHD
ncbi:MAG TPA: hypothetical protein VN716_09830, partial [Vicinamibacterales bacterium]|nr:hypothetical protein [Vicinamibacterales bacterium]